MRDFFLLGPHDYCYCMSSVAISERFCNVETPFLNIDADVALDDERYLKTSNTLKDSKKTSKL